MMETNTIDLLDRQLTQCLSVDGRASFSQIAEILGVSGPTVARRYRRLRSAGSLRVAGLRTPQAEGFVSRYLRMRCVPGSGAAIALALARRADTAWVQLLSDGTEVLCSLRGDPREATGTMLARMPRSSRIVAVTAYSRLHMFTAWPDSLGYLQVLPHGRVAALGQAARGGDGGYAGPGEPDTALLAALARDGRATYADLASATGWSEATARRRIDQLRGAGMLYFDLELDLPAFGFRSVAWLWLSVPPSHLASAGAALAAFPEVSFAVATTGPANLAACAVCRDEEELYQFLTAKVGALPGVERVETAPVVRTIKQGSPVIAPGI